MTSRPFLQRRVLELAERAADLTPDARDAFLREECAGDVGLLDAVRDLLGSGEIEGDLLPSGALEFIDRFHRQLDGAARSADCYRERSEFLGELLSQLRRYGARSDRFVDLEEIGSGGMGVVFRARDRILRRDVALKQICGHPHRDEFRDPSAQIRFLQEAQVVAQLDHPNIPTVHEIGVDDAGRLFFTMPLVEGQSLATVLSESLERDHPWKTPRAIEAILQTARVMAHAHGRGVVHRDLKPANLMLGVYGALQVVDWGIACILDEKRAIALWSEHGDDTTVASDLSDAAARDDAFRTGRGSTLGTPSYMAPEQARRGESVGITADVYSLGAILYEVLAGHAPYANEGRDPYTAPPASEILAKLRFGPPTPIRDSQPAAPPELVAICERAMARDPERRFATLRPMIADLEAFLSGRVVGSYERGVWPELRQWFARNRMRAITLGIASVVSIAAAIHLLTLHAQRVAASREIRRLSAVREVELLERDAEGLWPARAHLLEELEAWRDRAMAVMGELPDLVARRTKLRAASPVTDGAPRFDDPRDEWMDEQLSLAIADVEALGDEVDGPLRGESASFGPSIERRIEWARAEARRLDDATFRAKWNLARDAIAASDLYGGLRVAIEGELVPIGPNEQGYWEFALVTTGGPAGPSPGTPESPVVLVLLPALEAVVGTQRDDPEGPNYAPDHLPSKEPPFVVALDAFYISKFEISEAQWRRMAGPVEASRGDRYPAVSMSWNEAARVMRVFDLTLPTEAQWEGAARAGTTTTWWTGADPLELFGRENVSFARARRELRRLAKERFGEGGLAQEAQPVDAGAPNPFGLVHVHGNVHEMCQDPMREDEVTALDAEGQTPTVGGVQYRRARGGSYLASPFYARSSARGWRSPDERSSIYGLRPVRPAAREGGADVRRN